MEITKAIIPAAGLGTRFSPYTKAIPKEMLPMVDGKAGLIIKPAIQHVVEEGLQSEITNFFIITSKGKDSIAEHFDPNSLIDNILKERNKTEIIASLEKIAKMSNLTYIRQSEPLGLGHAVWMARHSIFKEYFAIALPDDIIFNKPTALSQLIRIARQEKASVVAVQEVPANCVSSYGIVGIKKQITPNLFQLSHMVEKPHPKDAPSYLAVVGRYILSHKIFASLEHISTYATEELQLTDAISHMMQNNERVFAYKIQGERYDIGTPIGWIKALINLSCQDTEYGSHIKKFINELQNNQMQFRTKQGIIENEL